MPPYITGGIGTVAYETAKSFQCQGYNVIIIAPKDKRETDLNCLYYQIPIKNNVLKLFFMFFKTLKILLSNREVIIYSLSGTYCGIVSLIMSKLFKINYFVVAHGIEFIRFKNNFLLKNLIKKVYNNSSMVFSVSNFTKNNLISFGVKRDNIYVCYNGVNTSTFYIIPEHEKEEFRLLKNIIKEKFYLLTISRLDKRKGHLNTLKALKKIFMSNEKLKSEIFYLIGGKGDMYNELDNFIKNNDLGNNVKMLGFINDDEINKYYNICDLFIHPNIYIEKDNNIEGFGIVFLEAAAAGKTSIGGIEGGSSEAIEHNKTGITINGDDIIEIEKSILELFFNKDKLNFLSKNAYKNTIKNFNWTKITDNILDKIESN